MRCSSVLLICPPPYRHLQSVFGCPQNGELVARARAPEVVQGQIEDADASQSLRTHVSRLVASHVWILVSDPHAKVAVLVGQSVGVGAESLDGVADLSQWCILSLQVHVAGIRQLSTHLRPAHKSRGLCLWSLDDSLLVHTHRRHSSNSRLIVHLPDTAVRGNSDNHLGGRSSLGQPVLHLEVDVRLGIAVVQLVQRVGEVSFFRVAGIRLEIEGFQGDKVQVIDNRRDIVVDWSKQKKVDI